MIILSIAAVVSLVWMHVSIRAMEREAAGDPLRYAANGDNPAWRRFGLSFADGGSLYLRPFMIASEVFLGVKPSAEYIFAVIASSVGSYFKGGPAPVSIFVSEHYTRAAIGGTGVATGYHPAACEVNGFKRQTVRRARRNPR